MKNIQIEAPDSLIPQIIKLLDEKEIGCTISMLDYTQECPAIIKITEDDYLKIKNRLDQIITENIISESRK